ncbi:hypothetical protein TEA_013675 [Camellia sinensis var. sinensis]|uniref:Uncharacterized protein n=1 Tax=Camellia sinensis var. sinensis TaxID=542762 RepID=A0A4S4DQ77_CAMSN|nr:hypothetical protein TEA_013675 [Camellia sinensis var. sinensis]
MAQEEATTVRFDPLGDDNAVDLAEQYRTERREGGIVGEAVRARPRMMIAATKPISQVKPDHWHIKPDRSTLTEEELEGIRRKYQIPSEIGLRLPTSKARASDVRPGELELHGSEFCIPERYVVTTRRQRRLDATGLSFGGWCRDRWMRGSKWRVHIWGRGSQAFQVGWIGLLDSMARGSFLVEWNIWRWWWRHKKEEVIGKGSPAAMSTTGSQNRGDSHRQCQLMKQFVPDRTDRTDPRSSNLPEKVRDKLYNKGGKTIKSIEIKEPPKKDEPKKPKDPEKPKTLQESKESKEPPNPPALPAFVPVCYPPMYPVGICCGQCYEGRTDGPCYHGHGRPVPSYYNYGYGPSGYSGNRGCYTSRCDYFSEENPSGCTIIGHSGGVLVLGRGREAEEHCIDHDIDRRW